MYQVLMDEIYKYFLFVSEMRNGTIISHKLYVDDNLGNSIE